jgi:hypothetical protein
MEIAAEHPECQRIASRQNMKEGLLLNRVTRQRAYISMRDQKRSIVIEPHPANTIAPWLDQAAVPAGEALDRTLLAPLDQSLSSRSAVLMQHVLQRIEALFVLSYFQRHEEVHEEGYPD